MEARTEQRKKEVRREDDGVKEWGWEKGRKEKGGRKKKERAD